MSNLPNISVTHTFNGDVAAANKVDAAQLDTQLGALASNDNLQKAAIDRVLDGDNDLAASLVGYKQLKPELANAFASTSGWQPKASVAVATTANITLSGEQTVDGVLTSASRILVKNQTTQSQNGIYVTAAGAWTRATDADVGSELVYATVSVTGGSAQAGSCWICLNSTAPTIGTTAILWDRAPGAVVSPAMQPVVSSTTLAAARSVMGPWGDVVLTTTDRTLLAQQGDVVNVKNYPYLAKGDGTTDDTSAITAAISAAAGKALYFPPGTYRTTGTLTLQNHSTYFGAGWGSQIVYEGTGDAVKINNGINSSVGAHIVVRDLTIKSTNVASTGGTFVDVGSTYVYLEHLWIYGGKYGIIFDQTEISSIKDCRVETFTYGGIWLVNGDDHTGGALQGYTNCIQIERCQINTASVAAGIIDDGGTAHSVIGCNFNACQNHIVAASVRNLHVRGCEFEASTGAIARLRAVSYTGGDAVGACGTVTFDECYFAPVGGQDSITITSVNSLNVTGCRFSTSAATITGSASANAIFASGNLDSNVGTIFDSQAAHHWEHAAAKQTITVKNDYSVTGKVTASGLVNGSNIPSQVSFSTTVAVSTGISVNGGVGGRNILALCSCQNGSGNATASAMYLIRCGYDGNNFTATKISGDDGSAGAGASTFAFTQVSGVLYVANTVSGNGKASFFMNV